MLGLAMDFNVVYLMVFKILVDALDFAMDSAYACEFECMRCIGCGFMDFEACIEVLDHWVL